MLIALEMGQPTVQKNQTLNNLKVNLLKNNSGIIGPNSNKEIDLENNRIYTILRIVENINDEAELDLEITNSNGKIVDIDEPTWMQPQRTGDGGSVIYDPIGTISLTQSGAYNFENRNSTTTIYVVDDQSVDLQAFQQPGILVAFISCDEKIIRPNSIFFFYSKYRCAYRA
mgnify:CR=1 FL=1